MNGYSVLSKMMLSTMKARDVEKIDGRCSKLSHGRDDRNGHCANTPLPTASNGQHAFNETIMSWTYIQQLESHFINSSYRYDVVEDATTIFHSPAFVQYWSK